MCNYLISDSSMAGHHLRNAILMLVLLSCSLLSSFAYQFNVGGRDGWVVNPSENYNKWAERNRFSVNDTLLFNYKSGSNSVLVVTKDDYDKCNTASPILKLDNGDSVFKFDRSGPFYFISGNKSSCDQGQKLIIVVLSVRSPPSPPAVRPPTAAPPGASLPSPPPNGAGAPAPAISPLAPSPAKPGSPSSLPPAGGAPTPAGSPSSLPPAGGAPTPAGSPSSLPPAGGAPTPAGSPSSLPPAGGAPTPAGSPSSLPPGGGAPTPAGSPSFLPPPGGSPAPLSQGSSPAAEPPSSTTPGSPGSSTPGSPGSFTPGSGTPADANTGSPPGQSRSWAAPSGPPSVVLITAAAIGLSVFLSVF